MSAVFSSATISSDSFTSPVASPLPDMYPSLILPIEYEGDQKIGSLYLGDMYGCEPYLLKQNDIGAVLQVLENPPSLPENMPHLVIAIADRPNETINFEQCIEFIDIHRKAGKNVYVHCAAGISRSATIVIAYVMKYMFTNVDTKNKATSAFKFVKSKRPQVDPNFGFWCQLEMFAKTLNISTTQNKFNCETEVNVQSESVNSFYGDGSFDFISEKLCDKEFYRNAHWAITQTGMWDWFSTFSPAPNEGFTFCTEPNLKIIEQKMFEQDIAHNHSGASFAITLQKMNYIAKNGYDKFREVWFEKHPPQPSQEYILNVDKNLENDLSKV